MSEEKAGERKPYYKRPLFWLVIILLIASEAFLLFYLRNHLTDFIDSDDASELIMAKLLAEEGRLITPNWYYSTELKVLHAHLVYIPFFHVFSSWHMVRLCSIAVLHLIFILSTLGLCKACRVPEAFPGVALALILPMSEEYFLIVLMGMHYLPRIIIMLLSMGLIINYIYSPKKSTLFLVLILSVFSGMEGARPVIIFYLPLAAAALLLLYQERKKPTAFRDQFKSPFSVVTAVCSVGAATGFLLNITVLKQMFHFMHWDRVVHYTLPDGQMITHIFNGFLATFGFRTGRLSSLSVTGSNITACILLLLTVDAMYYGLRNRDTVSAAYRVVNTWFVSAIMIFVLLYSISDMQYRDRYNEPILVFSFFLLALRLKAARMKQCLKELTVFLGLLLLCVGFGQGYATIPTVNPENRQKRVLVSELMNMGYRYGYSTFWNANILTELSDGNIEMHSWWDSTNHPEGMADIWNVDQTYHWLQKTAHDYEKPDGKVFLLFSNEELRYTPWRTHLTKDREICRTSDFVVYGFLNYRDMADTINAD